MDFPEKQRAAPVRIPRSKSRAARRNAARWLRASMPQHERRKVSISRLTGIMEEKGLTWPPDAYTRAQIEAMRAP